MRHLIDTPNISSKFQFVECAIGITKTMQATLQCHHSSNFKNDIKMHQQIPVKKLNTYSIIRCPKEGKFEIVLKNIGWKRRNLCIATISEEEI